MRCKRNNSLTIQKHHITRKNFARQGKGLEHHGTEQNAPNIAYC